MDQIIGFLQERWYIVILAVIALFIVMKIIRTAIKWVIVLAVIAAILIYGFNFPLAI
jgi:hypothetical protein